MTLAELPAAQLMAAYDLGQWHDVRVLPGGKSRHYHVTTDRGEVVIRRSYTSKSLQDMQFEYELVSFLRAHSFPAHEIIPTRSGQAGLSIDGRLYSISVFVRGERYQAGNLAQLREMAHTLARYHTVIASFQPSIPPAGAAMLQNVLRERVMAMPNTSQIAAFSSSDHSQLPQIETILGALPFITDKGSRIAEQLEPLYPQLPNLIIHGGCRRGSALFAGDKLKVMLDFDSARREARIVDVAIALHDLAKIFTERGAHDHKVSLDLEIVQAFLTAYADELTLDPLELEALPALMQARPLKRALGKCRSLIIDRVATPGHIRKAAQEIARVRWLEAHYDQFHGQQPSSNRLPHQQLQVAAAPGSA